MRPRLETAWEVSPAEARKIQLALRDRVELENRLGEVRRVAGADVALEVGENRAIGAVVVYRMPELEEIERVSAEARLTFPYLPGLLSFRELPVILKAIARVRQKPDVIFYDGHGYAHPRRFGIACHLGVALDCVVVGCAKSRLVGRHEDPGPERGAWTALEDKGERIGAVLRTRTGVNPIYVSQGHRVSLERSIELVLAVTDGYRIPRPTRDADHFAGAMKRAKRGPRTRREDG